MMGSHRVQLSSRECSCNLQTCKVISAADLYQTRLNVRKLTLEERQQIYWLAAGTVYIIGRNLSNETRDKSSKFMHRLIGQRSSVGWFSSLCATPDNGSCLMESESTDTTVPNPQPHTQTPTDSSDLTGQTAVDVADPTDDEDFVQVSKYNVNASGKSCRHVHAV